MSGKTALVLSAGGMFGAYQAGVWAALHGVFRPDLVVGVSAGSLNAWAIGGGATPAELAAVWRDPQIATVCRRRRGFRPWAGVFDSVPLHEIIRNLWGAYTPRMPVGVTAVELRGLRSRLFTTPDLRWEHLAASCAVLFGYQQVRIGGRYYTDGGLLDVLPLWAAVRMGADRAIAVNVLGRMPSATVRAFVSCARAFAPRAQACPQLEVCLIAPGNPLGTLREALTWEAGNIERFLAEGERDGAAFLRSAECAGMMPAPDTPMPEEATDSRPGPPGAAAG